MSDQENEESGGLGVRRALIIGACAAVVIGGFRGLETISRGKIDAGKTPTPASSPDNRGAVSGGWETRMHWYDADGYTVITARYPKGTKVEIECPNGNKVQVTSVGGVSENIVVSRPAFETCGKLDLGEIEIKAREVK